MVIRFNRYLFISSLLLCFSSVAVAQEHASIMDQVLTISIDAKVSNEKNEVLWGMEHNTLTISGRSVYVKLKGGNIEIFSHLTPYSQEDNTFLLVAHGEMLVEDPQTKEIHHYSGMDSISVKLGEKALFFPLGLAEPEISQGMTLSIEIVVDLYTNPQKKSTKR